MDTFKEVIVWLALAAASAPIWGALLWTLWEGVIRPRLILAEQIDELAAGLLERYGDRADEVATADEFHAWRHSNLFEQGKWRRVRRWMGRRRK